MPCLLLVAMLPVVVVLLQVKGLELCPVTFIKVHMASSFSCGFQSQRFSYSSALGDSTCDRKSTNDERGSMVDLLQVPLLGWKKLIRSSRSIWTGDNGERGTCEARLF